MRFPGEALPVERGAVLLAACCAGLALVGTRVQAAQQADLVIESVARSPSNPTREETVIFTITVRNQGDADAEPFYVGFWPDRATEPTPGDFPDESVYVRELPAGAAMRFEIELTPPLAAGNFTAWAYADRSETIDESDESNNAGPPGGRGWSVTASAEPDLFVESIALTPSRPVPGEAVTFTVQVTNLGGSAAGPFSVGFWSDRGGEPSITDAPDHSRDVIALAAGASAALDFVVTAPSAGRYAAYAYADRRDGTGEIAESSETNNVGGAGWRVRAPDDYEPDDAFADAKPISDGEMQVHSIHVPDDVDYLTFTLSGTAGVTARVADDLPWPWPDQVVRLYDSTYDWLATSNMNGVLHTEELAAGTYYLAGSSGFRVVDWYTLSLVVRDADAYEDDDSFAQAGPIADGETQTHSIHAATDRDYVQFSLTETGDVVLETEAAEGGTTLYLYDSTKAQITYGFSGRVGEPALPAGTYYARVTASEPIGSYTLGLSITVPEKPDLVVESITHSPSTPAPGEAVTFTVTVSNRGGVDAGGFTVGFWSDRPGSRAPDILDIPDQNADLGGLAAGASADLLFEVTAPSMGYYRAWAYADRLDGAGEVEEFDERNNTEYDVWEVSAADAYEADDTFAEANGIAPDETQTHSIHVIGDRDYVKFALGGAAHVELSVESARSVTIYLYDAAEALVASTDSLYLRPGLLAAGTYYAMVEERDNDGEIAGYELSLVLAQDAYEPDNSFAEASPIASGETQTHAIQPGSDRDFVTFTLSQPSDVILESEDQYWDTEIYLYDSSLTQIAYSGWSLAPIEELGLPAGTYYAMVKADSIYRPVDSYTLSLTASPPRPDLVIQSIAEDPSSPGPGDAVTFTVTVANRGTVDAGAFSVGFWSDWPGGPLPRIDDVPEQEADVTGLSAGTSVALDFVATAPSAGSYLACAYADRRSGTGDVAEFDEENNIGYRGWAVYAPDAYEIDDTFAQAKPIADGETQTHSIHVAGDRDHVTFTLSGTADVSIWAAHGEYWPSWDYLRICLFDASEKLLLVSEEPTFPSSWSTNTSAITAPGLAAGAYYVMAEYSRGEELVAEYDLCFGILVPDAYEPDDTFADASPITNGETQTHSVHVVGDRDYVEFSLSETSYVVLEAGGTAVELGLRLYDSSETRIGVSYVSRVSVTGLPPGTYYARVGARWYDVAIPSYTLSLEVVPAGGAGGGSLIEDDGCLPGGGGGGGGGLWPLMLALAALAFGRRTACG